MNVSSVVANDLDYICDGASLELTKLRGKRVLIVGGAGFLGYYMVQTLTWFNQREGADIKVLVLDNFKRGKPNWLLSLETQGCVEILEADITEPLSHQFPPSEFVIHAASIASPIFYRKFPIETMDANVNGLKSFRL